MAMITGISFEQFSSIIDTLNRTKYVENNIVIEYHTVLSPNRFRAKIGMSDSRGPGSRTSRSGRHGKWASWMTFYDIFNGVFILNESARIQTGSTVYRSAQDFHAQTNDNWQGQNTNIGSMVYPVYLCDVSVDELFDDAPFIWEDALVS